MLILIIIIALFIGLFFLVAAISLCGYIYNRIKGNGDLQKKCLKIFIPSVIVWFVFVLINAVLIIVYLGNNSEAILGFFKGIIGAFGN